MTLKITQTVYDDMVRAARDAAPLEACGLLAGRDCHVTKFYSLTNADTSAVHCRMIPEEQFAAVKDMRKLGLQMLAIWHSHPSTPARMSEEDLRLAFTPRVAYLILSIASPEKPIILGYQVDKGVPEEIKIVITDESLEERETC